MASYYDILNVSVNASDEEVKAAYRYLAKKLHPDANRQDRRMAELRFRLVNEAYAGLKTQAQREAYKQAMRKKRQKLRAGNDNTQTGFFSQISGMFRGKREEKQL